jgi:two-component system OmpR family response regulator
LTRAVKVLIVDKSMAVRERLFDVLSELKGVESVAQAGDCLQALAQMQTVAPDAVVLDIDTDGVEWMDMLRHVKGSNSSPRLIIFTNSTHPHVREKCMDLGADFFFDKSVDLDRVLDVVKSLT